MHLKSAVDLSHLFTYFFSAMKYKIYRAFHEANLQ